MAGSEDIDAGGGAPPPSDGSGVSSGDLTVRTPDGGPRTLAGFEDAAVRQAEPQPQPQPQPAPGHEPDARSVVQAIDPGGALGPALELRDAGEAAVHGELPPLRQGPAKYEVLGILGEGGMGKVYLAFDQDLRRRVALKVIRRPRPGVERQFLDEAQVLAQLDHPNIVPIFEIGLTEARQPYYTMRLVRGRTLQDVLRALRRGEPEVLREFPLVRRMQVLTHIAQAVAYAHAKGVVHRDLKPANVMLGSHGEVQVMDWGLSQVLAPERGLTSLGGDAPSGSQASKARVGTPAYMSPEQVTGEPVDARADVWALGTILYELLCLRRPFEGSGTEVMSAILKEEPPPPRRVDRRVPIELEAACLRALSKDRRQRQASADELLVAVQGWLESESDRAKRHERAEEKAVEGRAQLERYLALKDEVRRLESESRALAGRIERWRPVEEKQELVAVADRLRDSRRRLTEAATHVVGTLTEALGFEEDNATARELLADYHYDRFVDAEARQAGEEREYNARLLAQFHDGKYARELAGRGSLRLESDPPGAEVRLLDLVEAGFVVVPGGHERVRGRTPLVVPELEMGSYLAVMRGPSGRDVLYPVHITRNRDWVGRVHLAHAAATPDDMCFVPAGPFTQGGDAEALGLALPRGERWVDDFCIARDPVTVGAYLEFVNDLARRDGKEAAARRGPRPAPAAPTYLREDPTGAVAFALPGVDPEGDTWTPDMPVIGVSWHDAVAYCAWLARRSGRSYRLPTDEEWEKAARGVDGRWFPWGWRFDEALANTRHSRRERPGLVGVGGFPSDVSVYGVRGMSGNAADWTSTEQVDGTGALARAGRIMRGGSWAINETAARCAYRSRLDASNVRDILGFRLALTLP